MSKINTKYILILSAATILANIVFSYLQYKKGKRFTVQKPKTLDYYLERNENEIKELCKNIKNVTNVGGFKVWNKPAYIVGIMFLKKNNDLFIYNTKKKIQKSVKFDEYMKKFDAKKGDDKEAYRRIFDVLKESTTGYCKAMIKDNKCYMLFDSGPAYVITHKGEDEVYGMFDL